MAGDFQTIIRGGMVVDGSGSEALRADLGLQGGLITEIGDLAAVEAEEIIDAQGLTVAPGFIDMHSHADLFLPALPTADSLVRQGITTVVSGMCGLSPAPLGSKDPRGVVGVAGHLLDRCGDAMPWDQCATMAGYLEFLAIEGISLNIAPLMGQGILRAAVMGFVDGSADADQRAAIRRLAEEAMDQGAFGISTGLIYPPGSWSDTEELIDVVKVVGDRGGPYFSHIRNEGNTLLESVAEALEIGLKAGTHTQISHFKAAGRDNWDKSAPALELIEKTARNQPAGVDMYPYTAGSTALSALLPNWVHEGGQPGVLKKLADKTLRAKIAADMDKGGLAGKVDWSQILIVQSKSMPQFSGRRVNELAEESGKPAVEWFFEALIDSGLDMVMAMFGMSEDNRRTEITHPLMTIGTDGFGLAKTGITSEIMTHPRSFGTFPRVLGHYCRAEGLLSLAEAIHKMTGLCAQTLGLKDRGLIRKGLKADLTIFNAETISDTATYEQPQAYPRGIEHVLVAGEAVVKNNRHTGARPGSLIRKN